MNTETAAPEAEPRSPIRNFSVRLSSTPRGARLARLLATEQLRAWGLPLDPARHIVAELAPTRPRTVGFRAATSDSRST